MLIDNSIPIVLGASGHRQLKDNDIELLSKVVEEQIQSIKDECPSSPVKLLTCLAEGADQLCAEIALRLGLGLIAALPMEPAEYKKDFEGDALIEFEKLLSKAEKVIVVPRIEESENTNRDYYYRQADIYLAEHSHCLIALWDGNDAKSGGCGTAETVDFVLNHSYADKDRCVKRDDGFVIHINSPRGSEGGVGAVKLLGDETLFRESVRKLDELNKAGSGPDRLSVENGKKYHRALLSLAAIGTAITICFLLYDEVMLLGMLLALGILLVMMFIAFRIADKSKWHEKYIEYRVLAECLRIQKHLDNIGSDLEVSKFLDWNNRYDTAWICKAMGAASIFREKNDTEKMGKDWLLDQEEYHRKAAIKTRHQAKRNETIVHISVIASVALYIFTLVFEYGFSGNMAQQADIIRVILKIAIGAFSAAALFASNYYGKLSLKRVYEDHIKMADFFHQAGAYEECFGINDNFLKEVVKEELSENNNWYAYEKDNEVDLTI